MVGQEVGLCELDSTKIPWDNPTCPRWLSGVGWKVHGVVVALGHPSKGGEGGDRAKLPSQTQILKLSPQFFENTCTLHSPLAALCETDFNCYLPSGCPWLSGHQSFDNLKG